MPMLELYRLTPEEPPGSSEALVPWQMGQAVHRYLDQIFEDGILCPFGEPPKDEETGKTR